MPSAPPRERVRSEAFQALKVGFAAGGSRPLVPSGKALFTTGLGDLDRVLGGGFPRGALATLEGASSSGRTAIAAQLLARATANGWAAAVDDGSLFPPHLASAGVCLERLLVVPAESALAISRASDILLRSRAFDIVLLPGIALRATVWSRLVGLAHKADVLLLTLGPQASTELAYFAGTRVGCAIERVRWSEGANVFGELAGYDICARVLKSRRTAPGMSAHIRVAGDAGTSYRERAFVQFASALIAVPVMGNAR